MKQMQNILFALISYSAYLVLALFQTPPLPEPSNWKDIGLGTAFICACFWMFRYFTTHIKELEQRHGEQLAKKDEQYQALTKEVLEISKNAVQVQTSGNKTNEQVLELLKALNAKI